MTSQETLLRPYIILQSVELSATLCQNVPETGTAARFQLQIYEKSGIEKCVTVIESRVSSTRVLRFQHAMPKPSNTSIRYFMSVVFVDSSMFLRIRVSLRRRNDF